MLVFLLFVYIIDFKYSKLTQVPTDILKVLRDQIFTNYLFVCHSYSFLLGTGPVALRLYLYSRRIGCP